MTGGLPQRNAPRFGSLAAHIAELGDPVEFVWRYCGITIRTAYRASERDDLVDAALEAFVNACLAWRGPDSGYPLRAYVILRMRSALPKEIARIARRRSELGRQACLSDMEWTAYDPGTAALDRALDRADLARWANLADLSPMMRWGVEAYAVLGSPRERSGWYDAARAGIRHMRTAAASNRRREDHWTRARWAKGPGPAADAAWLT